MREHDLIPRRRRRFVRTTDSDRDGPIHPFVAREFEVHGPDQLWVADLTYVAIAAGFAYVALIMDAWSRRVVGYAIGHRIFFIAIDLWTRWRRRRGPIAQGRHVGSYPV